MAEVSDQVVSPCISECELDDEAICKGCYRTIDDIAAWRTMSKEQRLAVIEAASQRQLILQSR